MYFNANSSIDTLQKAFSAHQSGDLASAEKLYNYILNDEPNNSEALRLLGLIYFSRNQLDNAVIFLEKAAASNKQSALCHADLTKILLHAKQFAKAEKNARRTIQLNSQTEGIYNSLGLALEGQNKIPEALQVFQRCKTLQPNDLNIYINHGNLLTRLANWEEAKDVYNQALKVEKNFSEAHIGLAKVYFEINQLKIAIEHGLTAIKIAPQNIDALNILGLTANAQRHFTLATEYFSKALKLAPKHESTLLNLASAQSSNGDLPDAMETFGTYEQHFGKTPRYLNNLGMAKLNHGYPSQAIEHFEAALELDPFYIQAYYNLNASPAYKFTRNQIENINALRNKKNLNHSQSAMLNFIIGEVERKKGNVDQAFNYFKEGNNAKNQEFQERGTKFSIEAHTHYFTKLKDFFTTDFFDRHICSGSTSDLPVFVIGMPRSGTTLIQQIASAHSKVYGAGELSSISNIIAGLTKPNGSNQEYPYLLDILGAGDFEEMADEYLSLLPETDNSTTRVVDKMPFNFMHLGFISCLFPEAKIVHCQRNLLDTAVSCYFQNFTNDLTWTTQLEDIGHYIVSYLDLMKHWSKVLPRPILDINYEDLIQEPEKNSQRLIDFLDLGWENECLNYFEKKNIVTTASSWQVRQPIYKSAVDRWRPYEAHLGPLMSELKGLT